MRVLELIYGRGGGPQIGLRSKLYNIYVDDIQLMLGHTSCHEPLLSIIEYDVLNSLSKIHRKI